MGLREASGYPGDLILKLQRFRGAERFQGSPEEVADWLWKWLFHRFDATDDISIEGVSGDGGEHKLKIGLVDSATADLPLRANSRADRHARSAGVTEGPTGNDIAGDLSEHEVTEMTGEFPGRGLRLDYVGPDGKRYLHKMLVTPSGIRLDPVPIATSFPGFFLPARFRTSPEEDAKNYSQLEIRNEPYDFLEILKIVEPRLTRVRSALDASGVTLYGDIGLGEMLPLSLLGDGLARLTTVMLKIANARHGFVLVDEIENGLHHTIMRKVWTAIAEGARLFDVQIFATTHSWECIQAAHEAFSETGTYDFRLHRLDRANGRTRAVTYDRQMLSTAIATDLEVR